ncbi:DUF222 domain-containing protein [Microbacterium esteraromaticum]|uniref:HNH endonuclease signature motif containing protein n=1 Tax=Microbacterium esteraromaticum TaxID=57043 RepID=UPI001A8CC484|nr:HNH endonuclease signature motif containing protein [Microbacterium esteraromaticum]MBN8423440.1 DUF222 domain-containing protein [Microbacterium esteraromaticum]
MTALMDVTVEQVTTLDELVELAQSIEQSISSMQAARDGVLALASRWALDAAGEVDEADLSLRTVAAELGAALRVSDRTVQRRMLAVEQVVERFPRVWAAQGAGAISAGHTRVIVEAGEHIDDAESRDRYAARVLEVASGESPNRTRPIAERLAQQYQPKSLDERHEDACELRGAWVSDHPDAMAELHVFGPSVLVHGAFDRLTSMAKASSRAVLSGPHRQAEPLSDPLPGTAFGPAATHDAHVAIDEDVRTLAQRRFDLAMNLLLTGAPAGHDTDDGLLAAIRPRVSVTIPFLTLMDRDATALRLLRGAGRCDAVGGGCAGGGCADAGRGASDNDARTGDAAVIGVRGGVNAELDGHGPIDAHTARVLAGAASGWNRLLTHPITGMLLAVDRYRPSEQLRRHLRARDQRCRFPTCGMPAIDSDLDHTQDAAFGGATEESNLGALCRRHHVLKHHSPWMVEQRGSGLLEWRSPTGRVYVDRPPPQNTVTFTETALTEAGTQRNDGDGDGANPSPARSAAPF